MVGLRKRVNVLRKIDQPRILECLTFHISLELRYGMSNAIFAPIPRILYQHRLLLSLRQARGLVDAADADNAVGNWWDQRDDDMTSIDYLSRHGLVSALLYVQTWNDDVLKLNNLTLLETNMFKGKWSATSSAFSSLNSGIMNLKQ